MSYQERIEKLNPLSFNSIIADAREALPENCRRAPWIGLEHGVEPLDTEQKLDQYLAAYGKMHVEKIRMALSALVNPHREFETPVTIVDWGCGQALASCSLFEWMDEQGIPRSQIEKVWLIEPSELALGRAVTNVNAYLGAGCAIPRNTTIGNLAQGTLRVDNPTNVTIHLFSNVLDIETIDIDALSELIKRSFRGRQIFCCVSPLNLGSVRIQEFANKFGITEDNILRSANGHLPGGHGTMSLVVFTLEIEESRLVRASHVVKAEFVPSRQDSMVLQNILKNHEPAPSVIGKLVQFFRMVMDLERIKDSEIQHDESFSCIETNGMLEIDVSNSPGFIDEFTRNADPTLTRWPKDLLIGIDVVVGEKACRLFYCLIPFEELRTLDVRHQTIRVALRSFFVDLNYADWLNLSTAQIEDLEAGVRAPDISWTQLGTLVNAVVGNGVMQPTPQVQVAFSNKNVALAQICAELRTLDEQRNISAVPLLRDLLENAEFKNDVEGDQVQEDQLIRVVPMDENQQQAVAAILNNRVSVVTGPPGCGKTQLILNLMANALIRGKSVLVASKNNKAVDNVKDRFAEFDQHGCCLRFGSKKQLEDVAIPHLGDLLNLSLHGDLQETSRARDEIYARYQNLCVTLDEEQRNLEVRDDLTRRVDEDRHKEASLRGGLEQERIAAQDCLDEFESNHPMERDELAQDDIDALLDVLQRCIDEARRQETVLNGRFEQESEAVKQSIDEFKSQHPEERKQLAQADVNTVLEDLRYRVDEARCEEEVCKARLAQETIAAQDAVNKFKSEHPAERGCDQLTQSDVEGNYTRLRGLLNTTEERFSGIFARLFFRKKIASEVLDEIEKLPESFVCLIDEENGRKSIGDFKSWSEVVSYCKSVFNTIKRLRNYRKHLAYLRENGEWRVQKCQMELSSIHARAVLLSDTLDRLCQYQERLTDLTQEGERREQEFKKKLLSIQTEVLHLSDTLNHLCKCREELVKFQAEASERLNIFDRLNERGIEDRITEAKESLASLELGRNLVSATLNYNLVANDAARKIAAYKAYLPDVPWRREELPPFEMATRRFLDVFKLITVTSLSVKSSFPLKKGLFDILVIDEASQCDVASALPLILRAKQVVVIGDPKQLRHISKVKTEEEQAIKAHLGLVGAVHLKYADCSLWDYFRSWIVMADWNKVPLVLDRHYRCHPEIIGYSNEMFYSDIAIGGLQVCTQLPDYGLKQTGILWADVKGEQSATENVNQDEVNLSIELACQCANKYPKLSIGIVTPFAAQAEQLNHVIPNDIRDRVVANTVHKFQGDERDIMIYSLVVTDNSPVGKIHWVDYCVPNLVNVAVTRAKSLLIIVGNRTYVRTHSSVNLPLGYLESYLTRLGR